MASRLSASPGGAACTVDALLSPGPDDALPAARTMGESRDAAATSRAAARAEPWGRVPEHWAPGWGSAADAADAPASELARDPDRDPAYDREKLRPRDPPPMRRSARRRSAAVTRT